MTQVGGNEDIRLELPNSLRQCSAACYHLSEAVLYRLLFLEASLYRRQN